MSRQMSSVRPLSQVKSAKFGTRLATVACAISVAASAPVGIAANIEPTAEQLAFFEQKIRPLLVENCYTCHSADTNAQGGLRVDDRNGLLAGGNRGAAVVPGKPEESLLLQAVSHTDKRL